MQQKLITSLLFILGVYNIMSAQKTIVATDRAPKAIGPYNQAVVVGDILFASGQLGLDPETGAFVEGGIKEQTEQVLKNIKAVVEAGGFTMTDIVSCSVFLKDMNDFPAMNGVYEKYFPADYPSRATVQVARLPKDGLVEISCIAMRAK